MSRKKFKLTAFARFFIFILFLGPIAYLGAAYYNGEDGIQNIKDLIGVGEEKSATTSQDNSSDEVSEEFINGKLDRIKAENKMLEEKNNELHLEIEALKKALDQSQSETEQAKSQLKAIKDAVGG